MTSPSRMVSSTTSRVVPGIWVTMLFWVPESRFIRVDLPTLGRPTMTVLTPSRSTLPLSYSRKICSKSPRISRTEARRFSSDTSSMSSSG